MVAKTVKELCLIGYLHQVESEGNRKQILFTKQGEKLIEDTRKLLAKLDKTIENSIGSVAFKTIIKQLDKIRFLLNNK